MTTATKSSKYCTQCGAQLPAEAAFCIACGERTGKGPGPRATATSAEPLRRFAPVIVVGTLLAVGAVVVGIGYTNQPPPNAPLGRGAPNAPALAPNAALPSNHPPVAVPEDVRKVITRMETLAEEQPDNLDAWKQLAFVQYRAGQVDPTYLKKAEASYARVLAQDEKDLDALRGLGNVAYDNNDPEKALGYYNRYLEVEPGDDSVRTDMGTMLLASQRAEEAIRVYQGILQKDTNFFQAQFNLAIAYRAVGRTDLALAALQRSKEIAPDEDSKKRVEAFLSRVDSAGDAAPRDKGGGSLRESVEAVFRSHPIVGPRIDRIDWGSDSQVNVVLREFPMAGMPPMVKEKFMSRLRSGIAASKNRFGTTEPIEISLIDVATSDVMATLSE